MKAKIIEMIEMVELVDTMYKLWWWELMEVFCTFSLFFDYLYDIII